MPEDDAEPEEVVDSDPETTAASTSSGTKDARRARLTLNKVDDALVKFLSQPRESNQLLKKVFFLLIFYKS